ncbi:MAG: MFS transporter, partial [Phycisphaerales bacterium]|nr:MFS transporter [Phycisphaerales bacterium]
MSAAAPSVALLDAPRPAINPWIVAPIVAIAAFMEVLDTTIVNVALPHIAGSMSTTIDQSTWVLTSYLLANAIVLPLNGFMVSVFGRKRYFMGCMAVFTVSSLLCGLAPSYPILLVMRVIQGLGGGGLQPGAQSIMRDSFPLKRIGTAMAVYGIVVVVG